MKRTVNKRYVVLICAALAAAAIIVFGPVRYSEFVNYDDDKYVTENPNVTGGISRESVFWAFSRPHAKMWHPLTSLSHILDCQMFGLNPRGHHTISLLFHTANTLLLFLVLKWMTGAIRASGFVAAAFALHPMNVESVAWVAERKNLLGCFFWILTIAAYVRYAGRPAVGRYLPVVLAFCLGLMSKPIVVTLPFVLLLLDYWPLGRLQWPRLTEDKDMPEQALVKRRFQVTAVRALIVEKIPLFILVAILSVVTFVTQRSGGTVQSLEKFPLDLRITNAFISYLTYIEKMIWPRGLAVLYPLSTVSLWHGAAAAVVLLVISRWVIRFGPKYRYLAVGWLWYLGTLVPVIGLVQAGGQARADRYGYISLIGLFIIIGWGAGDLPAKWKYRKPALGVLAVTALLALAVCSRLQLRHWRNSISLFEHTVSVTDNNYLAFNNLGTAFAQRDEPAEAIRYFMKALRINPNSAEVHCNLGFALARQGRVNEAARHFTEALRIDPDFAEAHNLRKALLRQDEPE